MLYFSKIRIILITIFSIFFVSIFFSNFIKYDDFIFNKKINLGLDLQGGSYLLLEVQSDVLFKEELENISDSIRLISRNFQINITDINLDNKQRAYATGKRKNSIARVWLKRGSGNISVNGESLEKYFARPVLQMIVNQPLNIVDGNDGYEIMATVKGGGLSGQAGAIRHGISKALSLFDQSNRPALKKVGFLTRDPRVVERKKSGLAKARRSYQFSKR